MITLSFIELLNTGHLGPLAPGMNMDEVAELLGPPSGWDIEDAHPVPHYWSYGRHLEIAFRFDDRPRCNWFQLEVFCSLDGDAILISDDFVMSLDGLNRRLPLSRYVAAIRDINRVKVSLLDVTGSRYPSVLIDNVEIIFDCDEHLYEADRLPDEAIAIIESHAVVDSIYSYAGDEQLEARLLQFQNAPGATIMSGREYLDRVNSLRAHEPTGP